MCVNHNKQRKGAYQFQSESSMEECGGAKGRKRKEQKCYNYISFKIYIKVKLGNGFLITQFYS